MAISGSLKDVSVADVMQFIHLGRRTGTLLLSRGRERAMIGFHSGRLVSAQAPQTPKLGDLLVSSGMVGRGVLDHAIQVQEEEPERRSLGQILISSGAIAAEDLRNVIGEQIEQAVAEVMVWDSGTFEFAIDDLRPIDDIALYPSDVLPDADINTQMVLLEAARIFDERSRNEPPAAPPAADWREVGDSTHPSLLEPEPPTPDEVLAHLGSGVAPAMPAGGGYHPLVPQSAAERLDLQVVSTDEGLVQNLEQALRHELAAVVAVGLAEAGRPRAGTPGHGPPPPPIVLLDLRAGGVTFEQAGALHRRRPAASLIAVVDQGTSFARVYEAGVLAALPAEVEAVVACVDNVIGSRRDVVRGGEVEDGRSGVARLRRVFGDLRSGLISATVALNLMHIISESVERAVLFLVKRDQLLALGAFGVDAKGRPLAEVTRGIKLALDGDNVLLRSLETGEVQATEFDSANLPEPFRALVGRPANGQVVIFPVLGSQRVISVIYTDNGEREEPVEDIDILELATAQVGMAFENELLRRQISQRE